MHSTIVCTPRSLPQESHVRAAQRAIEINPANHPPTASIARSLSSNKTAGPMRERIALLVGRRWPTSGVRLTVAFLDNPPADLRKRILLHMNAWAKTANVSFVASNTEPKVRISRLDSPPEMSGYWSYLGTEILEIGKNEPTMNLEGFTMKTPESEYRRVVRHETGHTLGFPHEHLRRELINRIDQKKAIAYFKRTQDWTAADTRAQVLTPISEGSLKATAVDQHSIMCYQLPGEITTDGKPIIGGTDIDKSDYMFAASAYPKKLVS